MHIQDSGRFTKNIWPNWKRMLSELKYIMNPFKALSMWMSVHLLSVTILKDTQMQSFCNVTSWP